MYTRSIDKWLSEREHSSFSPLKCGGFGWRGGQDIHNARGPDNLLSRIATLQRPRFPHTQHRTDRAYVIGASYVTRSREIPRSTYYYCHCLLTLKRKDMCESKGIFAFFFLLINIIVNNLELV